MVLAAVVHICREELALSFTFKNWREFICYLLYLFYGIQKEEKKILSMVYEYDLFLSDNDNKFRNYSSSNWKNSSNAYDDDDNYLNDNNSDNIIKIMVTKLTTIE